MVLLASEEIEIFFQKLHQPKFHWWSAFFNWQIGTWTSD